MDIEQIAQCEWVLTALTKDAATRPKDSNGPTLKQPEWEERVKALCALARKALSTPTEAVVKEYLRGPMMPAWENRNPDQRNAFCQWIADLQNARHYTFEDEWGKLRAMLSIPAPATVQTPGET